MLTVVFPAPDKPEQTSKTSVSKHYGEWAKVESNFSNKSPGHTTQPDSASPESTSCPNNLPTLVATDMVRLVGDIGGSLHSLK